MYSFHEILHVAEGCADSNRKNMLTTRDVENKGVTEIWKDPTVFKTCTKTKRLLVWFLDFIET